MTKVDKSLPLNGESLRINGNEAFIYLPAEVDGEIPWVLFASAFSDVPKDNEIKMLENLLAQGVAVAGIDDEDSHGSPAGREHVSDLYDYLVEQRNFSKKPCLFGVSEGGLVLYSWAVENAEKVAGIAGLSAIFNLESYPVLDKVAEAYGIPVAELEEALSTYNPIERIKPLADAGVPIYLIHGENDEVAPYSKNVELLVDRYRSFGGSAEFELVESGEHDLWKGWIRSKKLAQFVAGKALGKAKDQALNLPGITINAKQRYVDIEAIICLESGALEFVACAAGTKDHESIITVSAQPMHIHLALLLLGAKPGHPASSQLSESGFWIDLPARGQAIKVSLLIDDGGGKEVEHPISQFIVSNDSDKTQLPTDNFVFAGSFLIPQETGPAVYQSDTSGHIISLSTFGDEIMGLSESHGHQNGSLMWQIDTSKIPFEETAVTLRLRPQFGN